MDLRHRLKKPNQKKSETCWQNDECIVVECWLNQSCDFFHQLTVLSSFNSKINKKKKFKKKTENRRKGWKKKKSKLWSESQPFILTTLAFTARVIQRNQFQHPSTSTRQNYCVCQRSPNKIPSAISKKRERERERERENIYSKEKYGEKKSDRKTARQKNQRI